ncbi:ZYRO0D10098p [Zygosaccharomyces rouxii]|uniref:ZYRO0D10098p n=1 Tax=Zygosaccharomyces rouxii (strain ATCC 2623 / CBS 732 / NBRC 1130 / NCYC 568 / NRRL Y-229) TaxID=559307 RepID=C5DVX1_ZYGRC|nr:uncharacterized protein ZYRO0D10098g [Zygosaccharomyces rouxii]CAR27940.1 ZYRO0D10098p [Zygosaccharomyces rouxii]
MLARRWIYPLPLRCTPEHRAHKFGTWCGINKDGRVGTVLNLKLDQGAQRGHPLHLSSRGKVPTAFLSQHDLDWEQWNSYNKFANQFSELDNTGDFNFFYGDCKNGQYKIIDSLRQTHDVLTNNESQDDSSYMVVSNDVYRYQGEETWPKVQLAKKNLRKLIEDNVNEDQDSFISKCFQVASTSPGLDWQSEELLKSSDVTKQSIFVPPLKFPPDLNLGTTTHAGFYGTRSQIVLLVSKDRQKVTFVERVLHNSDEQVSQRSPDHPAEQLKFQFDLN